jgi:hypothetical protein
MRLITGGGDHDPRDACGRERDVRSNERQRAGRHRRPRLHDLDEQEDREGRHVRDQIHDLASIHDFHLTRPGVNKRMSVTGTGTGTGTTKWTVKLKKGTYHFVCDPHQTIMHGA